MKIIFQNYFWRVYIADKLVFTNCGNDNCVTLLKENKNEDRFSVSLFMTSLNICSLKKENVKLVTCIKRQLSLLLHVLSWIFGKRVLALLLCLLGGGWGGGVPHPDPAGGGYLSSPQLGGTPSSSAQGVPPFSSQLGGGTPSSPARGTPWEGFGTRGWKHYGMEMGYPLWIDTHLWKQYLPHSFGMRAVNMTISIFTEL